MRDDRTGWLPPGSLYGIAGALGLAHLAILFTDRPDTSPAWALIAASVAFASATGFVGGAVRPSSWWSLAALGCWGAPVWGAVSLAMGAPEGAAIFTLPLGGALAASWLGARRPPSRRGNA